MELIPHSTLLIALKKKTVSTCPYFCFSSLALFPLFRDYFKDFTHLAFVRLNRNQLSDKGVPKGVFNISTLLDLQLSHNQLASIPMFSSHLEHLHLNHNSIESESAMQCNPSWPAHL